MAFIQVDEELMTLGGREGGQRTTAKDRKRPENIHAVKK